MKIQLVVRPELLRAGEVIVKIEEQEYSFSSPIEMIMKLKALGVDIKVEE